MKDNPSNIPQLLYRAAEWFALFLLAVMPVKFAAIVSVPEMPASYWFDFISIVFTSWPIHLFSFFSAILLALASLAALCKKDNSLSNGRAAVWTGLFLLLALFSLGGWVNASSRVYAGQMIGYTFGTGSFLLALYLLLKNRPGFAKGMLRAVLTGAAFSAMSGLYQYFWGFDALKNHVYEQNLKAGAKVISGQFYTRIQETRLQADFSVCNTYAGFLAMLLPVAAASAWIFGNERVQPEKQSRWILSIPVVLLFFMLIVLTGSRGGLLAVTTGVLCLCFALPLNRKARISLGAFCALCVAGFFCVVVTGRGFRSMFFRFDYDWAAIRMMGSHPFLGTGWGDFFHDYQILKLLTNEEAPHTPHNFPLLFGSQCGVAAFLTACAILLLPLLHSVRAARKASGKDILLYALVFATGAAVADFLLEITYETPAFLCTFGALALLLFFRVEPEKKKEKTFRVKGLPVILLCFAMTSGVLAFLLMRAERAFCELQDCVDPRFSRDALLKGGAFLPPPPGKVMKLLETASDADPFNPFIYASGSDYMLSRGDYAAALGFIDEAIRRSPRRAAFYLRRAQIIFRITGDPARASEDLKQVRALFPMNHQYRVPDRELLMPKRNEP